MQSGWNDGKGISTRELGRRLKPYSIRANTVRIAGVKAGNGYRREQFLDAWGRYLQADSAQKPGQPAPLSQEPGFKKTGTS